MKETQWLTFTWNILPCFPYNSQTDQSLSRSASQWHVLPIWLILSVFYPYPLFRFLENPLFAMLFLTSILPSLPGSLSLSLLTTNLSMQPQATFPFLSLSLTHSLHLPATSLLWQGCT